MMKLLNLKKKSNVTKYIYLELKQALKDKKPNQINQSRNDSQSKRQLQEANKHIVSLLKEKIVWKQEMEVIKGK